MWWTESEIPGVGSTRSNWVRGPGADWSGVCSYVDLCLVGAAPCGVVSRHAYGERCDLRNTKRLPTLRRCVHDCSTSTGSAEAAVRASRPSLVAWRLSTACVHMRPTT